MAPKSVKKFQDLLLKFSQAEEPHERAKIEKVLWENYGEEQAVFVLDMSGFSRLTRKYGIIHYLSMVRRMQLTTEPIVLTNHFSQTYRPEHHNFSSNFIFDPWLDPAVTAAQRTERTLRRDAEDALDQVVVHAVPPRVMRSSGHSSPSNSGVAMDCWR